MQAHDLIPSVRPAYGRETAELVLDIIRMFPDRHAQSDWYQESEENEFRTWGEINECGSACCLAGWVAQIHAHDQNPNDIDYEEVGMRGLDLSEEDANALFYSTNNIAAVRALEFLAKGESIDWDQVWPERTHQRNTLSFEIVADENVDHLHVMV